MWESGIFPPLPFFCWLQKNKGALLTKTFKLAREWQWINVVVSSNGSKVVTGLGWGLWSFRKWFCTAKEDPSHRKWPKDMQKQRWAKGHMMWRTAISQWLRNWQATKPLTPSFLKQTRRGPSDAGGWHFSCTTIKTKHLGAAAKGIMCYYLQIFKTGGRWRFLSNFFI